MKATVKAALITGILGIVGTVTAAFIGKNFGEENAVQQLYSQITTINGNNNTVTVNSVDEFVTQYNKLLNENETLKSQNSQYFSDYTEQKNINNNLELQLGERPVVTYENIGLCINGEDIPINKQNSIVIIDGREYYSKELAESFLDDTQNITIKEDTLFIGKVIADKASLFDQHIHDALFAEIVNTSKDAFGNSHSNVLYFNDAQYHKIIFALNKEYSLLKMKFVPSEDSKIDNYGNLIIYADKDPVRSFDNLNKESSPFEDEIPINNCTLLTIEYNSGFNNQFLIYDAIVYN